MGAARLGTQGFFRNLSAHLVLCFAAISQKDEFS